MKRKSKHRKPKRSTPCNDTPLIGRHPDVSDEQFEAFMKRVRAFEEEEPTTTLARLLIRDGIELPSPDTFTENTVPDKLWEVIHAMARQRHYLTSTDHLSDLELYRHLWETTLNHPTDDLTAETGNCACHIDVVAEEGEESTNTWLRFYADEFEREEWARDFPEGPIPEHVDPPHDRDQQLPKPFV